MDCLTELAKELVSKLGDLVVDGTIKHCKYMIQHKEIIVNLKEEHKKLKHMKQALQGRVDAERRNGHEITPNVQKWLSDVGVIENELQRFYDNEVNKKKKCFGGKCPDLAFNYSLGKQASKSTEHITSLKEEENKFQQISYPKAPPPLGSTFTKGIKSFESREKIITKVIEKLKDDKIERMSICGIGGVGKTTLVKELIQIVEKSELFDRVVMAVVSQNPNYMTIQSQIADGLGLSLTRESIEGRATQLLERLNNIKKVLIVLDDVWSVLDFERIGLPSQEHQKGCKILFTSRNEEECRKMGSQENFIVSVLSEDEAWYLFQAMAGDIINKPDIHPLAKQVVKECGCLPLAIVIVGKALKNKEKPTWEDSLEQLRSSQPSSFLDVQKYVYSSIELSLNFLGSGEHKFFLMLCSLFPEDFDIPVESLSRHAMGLGLFKAISASWKARNRVHTLVGDLIQCSLLMDSDVPGCVKMHDIVRDATISVASRVEHGFGVLYSIKKLKEEKLNYAIAISLILDDVEELENDLEYPTLQLLQVQSQGGEPNPWPEHFFEGMHKLKVLTMQNLCIPKLPSLSQASINLHTLQVEYCEVRDISIIGKELIHLQILSFAHSNIEELPTEIGNLGFLRLLDLTGCNNLNFIYANVLSRLSQLEELYLRIENFPWKKNDDMVKELQNMSHQLKVVELKVRGVEILAKDLDFKNLEKFWVYLAPYTDIQRSQYLESNLLEVTAIDYNSIKSMLLIMQLVKKCETLLLRKVKDLKTIIGELSDSELPFLKDLRLDSCSNIEYLTDYTLHFNAFPQMQSLSLKNLNNLREIFYASGHHKVKESMFKLSYLVNLQLSNLPSLIGFSKASDFNEPHQIQGSSCAQSTKLAMDEENELSFEPHSKSGGYKSSSMSTKLFSSNWMQQFPRLETLWLQSCTSIDMVFDMQRYSTSDSQVFPQLKEIKIFYLNQLRCVWIKTMEDVQGFGNLRSLTISNCNSLRHVFTLAIIKTIAKFEQLDIRNCYSVENLVVDNEDYEKGDHIDKEKVNIISFHKLDSLTLVALPSFVGICANSYELELPSLRKLIIDDCPKLNVSFWLTAYAKHDNLPATSYSNVNDIGSENFEENYSRSYSKHFGCAPLCSKLIRQSNIKKKSNQVPSISVKKTKVEVGHLPILEELEVRKCDLYDKLMSQEGDQTRIRRGPVIDGHLFPNLKSITMRSCSMISVLLSPSSLRCLRCLEKLRLWDCVNIEAIVSQEEAEASANKILFTGLQCLLLTGLPNIKAFCQASYDFDFPSLKEVTIIGCPKMEFFSQGSSHAPKLEDVTMGIEWHSSNYIKNKDLNATIQGFKAFMALQGHEMLRWTKLHNEGMFGYLMKNAEIDITKFHKLSKLVSFNEIQMLQHVRKLTIEDCDSLVEVFESEGEEGARKREATTHYHLEQMSLEHLPKLSHIWNDNIRGVVSFQKLTSIYIRYCHCLKSLLSHSMARSLVQLQQLSVEMCDRIEKIVTKENENIEGGSKVKILFPELKTLRLKYLPMLECVCSGDYDYDLPLCDVGDDKETNNNNNKIQISFPKLEYLQLFEVPKVKCFCSGAYDYDIMASSIEECSKITTFPHGNVIVSTPNLPSVTFNYYDIPTLGDLNLTINYIHKSEKYEVELQKFDTFRCIEQDELLLGHITRQKRLFLQSCHKLLHCIPSSMMTLFSHLVRLIVRECACLEEIFESNDYEGDNSVIQYALWSMDLYYLPKLKHIWKNHGQVLGFKNLTCLTISQCHDLKYVFSDASIARSLPELHELMVYECNKMEEIIQNNSDSDSVQPKEAKIIFPSLSRIELKKLPNLNCFCSRYLSCYVELPHCYVITIDECPNMETFSYFETVYTPSLTRFRVENTEFDVDDDVNEVIQHRVSM